MKPQPIKNPIFITGIGTGVGKTLVSAIITEALQADYWKPIQAGLDGTDSETVADLITNKNSLIHPELYRLQTPASPHIAAKIDNVIIDQQMILANLSSIFPTTGSKQLVVEGAGGLLVPLADGWMVADLIKLLQAKVILVSRNYLGSINHSLLTASYCRSHEIDVAGWIFTDDHMQYEEDIVKWSGYVSLGSVPKLDKIDRSTIHEQAMRLRPQLMEQFR